MDQKMQELYQLYKDNEALRTELITYRSSVDVDSHNRNIQKYIERDELATRAIRNYLEFESFLDNVLMCTMC